MAQWIGQTNQKLYQARLLVDACDLEANDMALKSALYEGALFQLHLAYDAYLHELAETAQCRVSFSSLSSLVSVTPLVTGEMKELVALSGDNFSWLNQLLSALNTCAQPQSIATPQVQRIGLLEEVSSAGLRGWYEALSEIIDLQRGNRQES